ncbi:MAG: endonuclease NucS [Bifidobacteriaceae bacterium]|jgi:RecB family endonuclease NucS|nr:endonuclease NucS [Bifidobacteriaceae bacterium]
MRLVVARCAVDYSGRLGAHLDPARRLIMVKADGSVLVHADGGSYKPLNWMNAPCRLSESEPEAVEAEGGVSKVWRVAHRKTDDCLRIALFEVFEDIEVQLGDDSGSEPGLVKDGVEAHLQALLAERAELVGPGLRLIRREYATAIGPVDLLLRDPSGGTVAVEVKRRGEIDGVEQLTRYVELLKRDSTLAPVRGVLAAQAIKPQAQVLAQDRGLDCLILDYEAMRGEESPGLRLF